VTTLACAVVGVVIPFSPLADTLGFTALPGRLLVALALMVATYLALVEAGKYLFFKRRFRVRPLALPRPRHERRVHRRAAPWSRPPRVRSGPG
jgi:Mg2+-importing ATPase